MYIYIYMHVYVYIYIYVYNCINLRRGDESQPRVRIFFVSAEKCRGSCLMLFKWATLLIPIVNILNPLVNHHFQTQSSYTKNPNVLLQSPQTSSYNPVRTRLIRSPNHLQHVWKTSPCFATLRPPFLSITSHPPANYLVPSPNGRCSPLSFGVPPCSFIFPLLFTIFLHFLSFFSNLFPAVPPLSSVFLLRNLP